MGKQKNSDGVRYEGMPCVVYDADGTPVAKFERHPLCPVERYEEFLRVMFGEEEYAEG